MLVRVSKPVEGKVTVVLDDRRGATQRRVHLGELPVEGLAEALAGPIGAWEVQRKAIREARKGRRT